jgi:hypothetical protein
MKNFRAYCKNYDNTPENPILSCPVFWQFRPSLGIAMVALQVGEVLTQGVGEMEANRMHQQ